MTPKIEYARVLPRVAGLPRAGIRKGLLTEVRAGVFVLTNEWDDLFSEGRLRTRALAAWPRHRAGTAVLSHCAAASFYRLPLYRVRSDRVDVIEPTRHPRRNGRDIVRHQLPLPAADVVTIDGVRVTTLDRTVYDVIRSVSLEAAAVVFDAALRMIAWDDEGNTYDLDAAERFRALVNARIRAGSGARGIRQARFIAEFADGRAQLPGESVARLWMWQLGLPAPRLQHRVELPRGRYALLDFAWPELGRWAEFDGEAKYTDAELRGGRTAAQVMADQKERENLVRARTGWRCDRWSFSQMPDIDAFARHLRSIGLSRI